MLASMILFASFIYSEKNVSEISITKFIPSESKLGDVQLSIRVQNLKNETLENVLAFVSGRGFSTYEVIPIESLSSGEEDYIFVFGNFRQSGNVTLTIRINDNIFYRTIDVKDESTGSQQQIDELMKAQDEKRALLLNLTDELEKLREDYNALEDEFWTKKDRGYDASKISLNDLKSFIRNAQTDILQENAERAKVNLKLAQEEYDYLRSELDSVEKIPFIYIIKDNAVIFSAIAGALITFFALSELLRRKGHDITEKIVHIKKPAGKK